MAVQGHIGHHHPQDQRVDHREGGRRSDRQGLVDSAHPRRLNVRRSCPSEFEGRASARPIHPPEGDAGPRAHARRCRKYGAGSEGVRGERTGFGTAVRWQTKENSSRAGAKLEEDKPRQRVAGRGASGRPRNQPMAVVAEATRAWRMAAWARRHSRRARKPAADAPWAEAPAAPKGIEDTTGDASHAPRVMKCLAQGWQRGGARSSKVAAHPKRACRTWWSERPALEPWAHAVGP